MFPFSRTVAEHYAAKFQTHAPIIEVTGTGGGMQIFCGKNSPIDLVNASRRIKPSEEALCKDNGVHQVVEFKIGYDGIVIAGAPDNPLAELSLRELYLALAKDIPSEGGFIPNPYERWSEVNPRLPDIPIEVHGPPPTSGTRDAFVELALETGAKAFDELARLAEEDKTQFAARAGAMREDGRWIDEGENDNAIIQIIRQSRHALGVFGFSFYDQNRTLVEGLQVEGAAPDFNAIAEGRYSLARSLYFYADPDRATPQTVNYVLEFTSESAIGPYGYLLDKGLIPLPPEARRDQRTKAETLLTATQPRVALRELQK